jgi:predicted RND superfamily exporter protein
MMKNSYMSAELQQAEQNLNKVTSLSKKTIYLVTPGATMDEALAANENLTPEITQLKELGILEDATVVTDIFHSAAGQLEAIERWETFWASRKERVVSDLQKAGEQFKFKPTAFHAFAEWIEKDFQQKSPTDLPILSQRFFENFTIQTDTVAAVINVLKVNSNEIDINRAYEELDKIQGSWLIDKRMITSEFMNILKDNFDKLILISLSIVFVILLLAYGRIELTLVTMIPIFFSWIWVVGIMAVLGISFNIFNVIILTFIFGLGIDYSIFIMRGLLQQYKFGHTDQSS